MNFYQILLPYLPTLLLYQSQNTLPLGSLVNVALGKRIVNGIIVATADKPDYECSEIKELLIPEAVSKLQLELCRWMSHYYYSSFFKCVALFVPPVIWSAKRKPKRDKNNELLNPDNEHPSKQYHGKPLTKEQKGVLKQLFQNSKFQIPNSCVPFFLLHGITGSGKTEIYLQLIKKNIQEGRQTVLLVPEIALTSELIRHFAGHFPDQISIIHSKISEGARLQSWHRILEGKTKLILGSRSALFTPWRNLGAIILDEEHEWTYKQEQTPRYHARTVAEKIVQLSGVSSQVSGVRSKFLKPETCNLKPFLLLGSATPSIETYFRSRIFFPNDPKNPKDPNNPSAFLLLGSATPSIETYYSSTYPHEPHERNEPHEPSYSLLSLPFRATSESLPRVTVVDLRQEFQKKNLSMISDSLADAITDRLQKKEQVILFLNKRGASSCVICRDCGFTPRCKRCDLALTYHIKGPGSLKEGLLCHSCGSFEPNLLQCPVCKSLAIRYVGSGTQKAHQQLQQIFPSARILRADKDTASGRHAFEQIYQKMWNQEADILLGTQMITKGLDLPKVTLVGILIADIGLHIPDFRASERVFQLLMQVAGRSGRHQPGEVIIQTYQPEHPAIKSAANHDYLGFYKTEIAIREQFFYPPFSRMIRLTYSHKDEKKAQEETFQIYKIMTNEQTKKCPMEESPITKMNSLGIGHLAIGISQHFIPRLHGKYIWNILIRGENPKKTLEGLTLERGWKIDVDPHSS